VRGRFPTRRRNRPATISFGPADEWRLISEHDWFLLTAWDLAKNAPLGPQILLAQSAISPKTCGAAVASDKIPYQADLPLPLSSNCGARPSLSREEENFVEQKSRLHTSGCGRHAVELLLVGFTDLRFPRRSWNRAWCWTATSVRSVQGWHRVGAELLWPLLNYRYAVESVEQCFKHDLRVYEV
jgi:hypothetical protein